MAEIGPIRPLNEAAALDWLRSQPGGRINLPAAELGLHPRKRLDEPKRIRSVQECQRGISVLGFIAFVVEKN
jgi:hypothetical protein